MIALCRDKTSGSRTIAEVVAYGALHQRNRDSDLPLFHSDEYRRVASLALDYPRLNKELAQEGDGLNVYGYPYNSLAFEWPYVPGTSAWVSRTGQPNSGACSAP